MKMYLNWAISHLSKAGKTGIDFRPQEVDQGREVVAAADKKVFMIFL